MILKDCVMSSHWKLDYDYDYEYVDDLYNGYVEYDM